MGSDERRALATYLTWRDRLPDVSALPPEVAWEAFQDAHGARCAMCRKGDRRLVMDHCHETGRIRALLCDSCNTTMSGRLADVYEAWPPAAIAGLCRMYPRKGWGDDGPAERRKDILWHVDSSGAAEADRERVNWDAIRAVQNRRRPQPQRRFVFKSAKPAMVTRVKFDRPLLAKVDRHAGWFGVTREEMIKRLVSAAIDAWENPTPEQRIAAVQNRRPPEDGQSAT